MSASNPLDTGFGFGYYPFLHTGATAWYLLAGACADSDAFVSQVT